MNDTKIKVVKTKSASTLKFTRKDEKPNENELPIKIIPTFLGAKGSSPFTESMLTDSKVRDREHCTYFVGECDMPTITGFFKMRSYSYQSPRKHLEPIIIMHGNVCGKENVLVRVHDQCLTSEVFGSKRCGTFSHIKYFPTNLLFFLRIIDCREQLAASMKAIQADKEGGIVIYLQQEGRGIGIANKVAAYSLQDHGADTMEANLLLGLPDEMREYLAVPDILQDIGIRSIRLMTNNPYKIEQLKQLGVKVVDRVPIQIAPNRFNKPYLLSKRDRMRHLLSDDLFEEESSEQTVEHTDSEETENEDSSSLSKVRAKEEWK